MKKVNVAEATKVQLDWLVMKCLGYVRTEHWAPQFCMDWSQMGPIIESEGINPSVNYQDDALGEVMYRAGWGC